MNNSICHLNCIHTGKKWINKKLNHRHRAFWSIESASEEKQLVPGSPSSFVVNGPVLEEQLVVGVQSSQWITTSQSPRVTHYVALAVAARWNSFSLPFSCRRNSRVAGNRKRDAWEANEKRSLMNHLSTRAKCFVEGT